MIWKDSLEMADLEGYGQPGLDWKDGLAITGLEKPKQNGREKNID
jgi:hypothetical protein